MSVKVMGGVWDLALDPSAKLVLLALADHADHEGRKAHPSVPLLAHKTGYSPRQVQRILRDLETAGLIEPTSEMVGGRGRPVHYTILLEKGDILTPFRKGDVGVRVSAPKGDICDTERVTSATGKGDIPLRAHVDKPLTVIEPSREPSSAASGHATYVSTLDGAFDALVAQFAAVDPDFTSSWIKCALVNAESQIGPLPRDQLGRGLTLAMRSIKTAIDGGRIVKPRAFAQKQIVTYLMEQRDEATT